MANKLKQQGFTIVELLIVIVVIGILALLVITTFTGIQKKARDTERTTDIKAIHSQLEAYYANNGYYPDLADVDDDPPVALKGLDADALKPPQNGTLISATAATTTKYQYVASPTGCTTANKDCISYVLSYVLEADTATTLTKDSLSN